MIFLPCQVRAEYNDFRLAAHLGRDSDRGSGGGEGQDHQRREGGEVKALVDMPDSTLDKEKGKALVSTLKKAVNKLLEK